MSYVSITISSLTFCILISRGNLFYKYGERVTKQTKIRSQQTRRLVGLYEVGDVHMSQYTRRIEHRGHSPTCIYLSVRR